MVVQEVEYKEEFVVKEVVVGQRYIRKKASDIGGVVGAGMEDDGVQRMGGTNTK